MALAYLLSPTFEIVNSAGKPATGGYLEVYVSGSRTKYYCASDFDGTLHPFRIQLDSLGSNIVLAESAGNYDVYVYNRYGSLLMSRYGVIPQGGGLYDDDASRLDWVRCTGSERLPDSDTYVPTYSEGTMEVGDTGVRLESGRYYHVTAHIRATKPETATPWYDRVLVNLSKKFPSGPDTLITQQSFVVDGSMLLAQDFEISCDAMVDSDCELKIEIAGDLSSVTYSVTDLEIHRVYSGYAQGAIFEQEQADWDETDTEDPSYIKNKPTLAMVATTGDYGDLLNTPVIPADKVYVFWDFEFNRTAIREAIAAHKVIMCWNRTSNEHSYFSRYEEVTIDGNLCELYHFAHIETDYVTPFATTWRLGDMCYIYDTVRHIQYAEHDTKLFNHEVPEPTSADAGKVLTASWNPDQAAGSWSWQPATTVGTITL